ncbi:hypothetical protein ACVI1L_008156 [Bradyrhizobium sp. USDA 4516]
MPAHFSGRHVENWDVIGGQLSLNEANSPSLRDCIQHSVNGFFARGRGDRRPVYVMSLSSHG